MTASAGAVRRRIASVDILRGLAMVVMVLDHTRDFAHRESLVFDPTDLDQTTPAIFLTRWITHFVAPIFVLLAGTSARLQLEAGTGRAQLARFLVVRGLWLVFLEFTVVRVGIWFNADPAFLGMLQVIWVLGVSMAVLAALVFLPDILIAAFGLAMVIGHNALDNLRPEPDLELAWSVLHERNNVAILSSQGPDLLILYPLIPWVGVLALGYVLGRVYRSKSRMRRRPFLVGVGLSTTAAWFVIRLINDYGDPRPWQSYPDVLTTVLSFLNAEKYPPSLAFLAMTLGPTLILLGLLDGAGRGPDDGAGPNARPATTVRPAWPRRLLARFGAWLAMLGAVPLFFYLLQWFVAHGLAVLAAAVAGQDVAWHFMTPPERFFNIPAGAGFPLPMVYLLWVAGIAILTPLCRWYGIQRAERGGILRYL